MFLAKAKGAEDGEGEALVLVKSLQTRDEQLQLDFRREAEMFGKLNHANVVRLLGLCREAEPHYMVLEYVDLVRTLPAAEQGDDSSGRGACKCADTRDLCCRMAVNAMGCEECGVGRREINLGHEKPGDFRPASPNFSQLRPRKKILACPTRQGPGEQGGTMDQEMRICGPATPRHCRDQ